jgi:hypothetical protein
LFLLNRLALSSYSRFLLISVFFVAILILPVGKAIGACLRFTDPVYRVNFEKEVSLYAKTLAGENNIFWVGSVYPLHPKDFIFDLNDTTTFIYSFYAHVVRFYTGKKVQGLHPPEISRTIKDGDAIILNLEPLPFHTSSMPKKLKPLVVKRARILRFERVSQSGEGSHSYESKDRAHARLEIFFDGRESIIQGTGIPEGSYEIIGEEGLNSSLRRSLGTVNAEDKRFSFRYRPAGAEMPAGVSLLYFDEARSFSPPVRS